MRDSKKSSFWHRQLMVFLVSIIIGACWSGVMSFYSIYGSMSDFIANGALWGICFALVIMMIHVVERFVKNRRQVYRARKGWTCRQVVLEVLKFVGIIMLVFLAFILWLLLSLDMQPFGMLVVMYLMLEMVYHLLKGESWKWWLNTLLVFAVVCLWYVFENDLPGPMSWRIYDNIIDTPSQWFDCYRLYWLGSVAYTTCLLGGLASSVMLLVVKGIRKLRDKEA